VVLFETELSVGLLEVADDEVKLSIGLIVELIFITEVKLLLSDDEVELSVVEENLLELSAVEPKFDVEFDISDKVSVGVAEDKFPELELLFEEDIKSVVDDTLSILIVAEMVSMLTVELSVEEVENSLVLEEAEDEISVLAELSVLVETKDEEASDDDFERILDSVAEELLESVAEEVLESATKVLDSIAEEILESVMDPVKPPSLLLEDINDEVSVPESVLSVELLFVDKLAIELISVVIEKDELSVMLAIEL
jgi:hypothetical protein